MTKKKKIISAVALLLFAGAFAVTGSLTSDKTANEDIPLHDGDILVDNNTVVTSDDVSDLKNADTYFQELRATLDMDRNKILAKLDKSEKNKLLKYMEQEKTVETLIVNKGLPESFVVITDTGINITVNTEDLDQATVTKICEIVMRQTERKASEIVVQDVS
ncbi:MAG: SpoIIIAH-like family protein [Clostridiales bacterium]|nr:SpoIIIAH-like family protein [Clostridiales bacterium]